MYPKSKGKTAPSGNTPPQYEKASPLVVFGFVPTPFRGINDCIELSRDRVKGTQIELIGSIGRTRHTSIRFYVDAFSDDESCPEYRCWVAL